MFEEVSDDLQCSGPREYVEYEDMLERDLEDLELE